MAVDLNPSSIEGYIDIECAIRQIWTFQNVKLRNPADIILKPLHCYFSILFMA